MRQQFTGQQRDEETGLDYFWARNTSAVLGRFLSMDPNNAGASLTNPQSWNAFGYVENNPLGLADPTGKGPVPPSTLLGMANSQVNNLPYTVYVTDPVGDVGTIVNYYSSFDDFCRFNGCDPADYCYGNCTGSSGTWSGAITSGALGVGAQAVNANSVRVANNAEVAAIPENLPLPEQSARRASIRAGARGRGLPGTQALTNGAQDLPTRVAGNTARFMNPLSPAGQALEVSGSGEVNGGLTRILGRAAVVGKVLIGADLILDGVSVATSPDPMRTFVREFVIDAGGLLGATLGTALGAGTGPGAILTGAAGGIAGADIFGRDVAPVIDDLIFGQ